jgi:peptidoglycan/xylan/chitin deacetylase (PgdA/CDA1 family)
MRAILTYHSIDSSGSPISIPPATFEDHLRWFETGRVRVLGLDELRAASGDRVGSAEAGPYDDGDAVALTFDDGFLNVREAMTRLLRAGFPATLFIVSRHVGGMNDWGGRTRPHIPTLPLLGWREIEHLAAAGAAIGVHTRSHPDLTTLASGAIEDELAGAVEDITARLGPPLPYLAYPYGTVNDEVAARTAAHFRGGLTVDFRTLSRGDSAVRLPRLDMYYFKEPGALGAWGQPLFASRLGLIRARRAIRVRLFGSGAPR